MTIDAYAAFSPCLRYRSPGNAPAWDDGCALYYFAALSEIPDADAPILMKAIMTGGCGKFRPDPDEVLTLWRKITKAPPAIAEEIAGDMLTRRRVTGIYQRKIPGDPYCRWEICEPPWTDLVRGRVSAGMGGWAAFCEDDSPLGVLRAQLIKLASAILDGGDDTTVGLLRLEYQAAHAKSPGNAETTAHELPDAPLHGLGAPLNGMGHQSGEYTQTGKAEAAQAISRIQSRTGDLRLTR